MNFVVDECCKVGIVEGLRSDGHDVLYVREGLRGLHDPEVLGLAMQEGRIVLTEDRHFGRLVIQQRLPTRGILYLRLTGMSTTARLQRVRDVLASHPPDHFFGRIVVVESQNVRSRELGGLS